DAQMTASGSDTDAYHYAMLDSDSESDTDHAQFRQYNSTQGRWHSPDPYYGSYNIYNPQSFNRYVYAKNNPLSRIDPAGLEDGDGCPDGEQCVWGDNGWGNAPECDADLCVDAPGQPDPPPNQPDPPPSGPNEPDLGGSGPQQPNIPGGGRNGAPTRTPEQQLEARCFAITASVKTLTVTATANGLVAAGAVAFGTFVPVTAPVALPFAAITGGIAGLEALGAAGLDLYGFVSGCK
ncbi:RHS repeat-associated core domain-containing protein, partial [Terracidiphilus sp.]|uniref:RHS repeat-associated core domain-containing protein n=1 Tax=Terracidiphilus sp. TaxID=1964191 RepID=UPI003C130533